MNIRLKIILTLGIGGFSALLTATAQGPDDKGSVLRSPFDAPAASRPPVTPTTSPSFDPDSPTPSSPAPGYLKNLFPADAVPAGPVSPDVRRGIAAYEEPADINRDLAITPAAGQWLILVISYSSKNGAEQARKMCLELREKNRVPAYVFCYGADERRKEYERVKKIIDQQREFFKQNGMTPDQPLRIRHQQIDVHHAVMIGGYPNADAANRALTSVRAWPPPDPTRVDLETMFYQATEGDQKKNSRSEVRYVNPFKRAFVCRNPTVKHEAPVQKIDVAALRRMNADEPYSLFNCKKPFTLAVKEFQTPYMMQDRTTSPSAWDFLNKSDRVDGAAISARNLAESLRKLKLDAYVLHAKFSSTITVGSYDSPDDPALKSMQEVLATRFNQPPFTQIQFFHRPVPMAVPK